MRDFRSGRVSSRRIQTDPVARNPGAAPEVCQDAMDQTAQERDEVLSRYMAEHGLKNTRQRNIIIDTFFGLKGHLSVEELWSEVRAQDARISVATVYRTMKLLHDCGLAHARNFGDGQTRYEIAEGDEHHDHLICTGCSNIVEFEDNRIEALQEEVARKHGFVVTSHKMELYGLCPACRKKKKS
jgi:Fur family ferric uptake transcriptional regulator